MEDFTITIYCMIDDYLQKTNNQIDSKRKMNDAEIITTAFIAIRYFGCNYTKSMDYMKIHFKCNIPNKSNFNRMLIRLQDKFNYIFIAFAKIFKYLNTSCEYIIDSFPIAVCKNIRIPRNKILKNEAYRGYNASKREYFYGFKIQVITTVTGIPVDYFIVAGSVHDSTALQAMNIDLPENSNLYADSGYTDYELENYYKELEKINLLVDRKSNSKKQYEPWINYIIKTCRKQVEVTFSEISYWLPKTIHAVTPNGFLLKISLIIQTFAIYKYLSI